MNVWIPAAVGAGVLLFLSSRKAAAATVPSGPRALPAPPSLKTTRTKAAEPAPPPEVKESTCLESPGGGRIKDDRELKPTDLVHVQAPDSKHTPEALHREAAKAYLAMVEAARKDGIKTPFLEILSGYRSDASQKVNWERQLAKQKKMNPKASQAEIEKKARKWVAPPGFSNHRTGRTIDMNMGYKYEKALIPKMQATAAHKWLVANAAKFGFYPYSVEPWHWEYNPACKGNAK